MDKNAPVVYKSNEMIDNDQSDKSKYGSILRATSVVGGGSILAVLIGLIRSKGVALLVGPAGLGVIGLLSSIMAMAVAGLGLGLSSSSIRLIASARDDEARFRSIRCALWGSNLVLGVVGLVLLAVLARPLALAVFNDPSRASGLAWVGVGILAALLAASQTALLQGLRRTGDFARAAVVGALLGTAAGLGFLAMLAERGLHYFVISIPAGALLGALWYTRGIRPRPAPASARAVWQQWRAMLPLGGVIMVTTLAGGGTDLFVRAVLARELGVEAAGLFQASAAISVQYVGLVLGAMAADYYPRISELVERPESFRVAVNDQLEVAVLLAGPLLLGLVALAPWVLGLLYSSEFTAGTPLLRWLVVADVLKLASWTIGFAILARGLSGLMMSLELSGLAVYAGATYVLVPRIGLVGAGVAFSAYVAWGVLVGWGWGRRWHGVAIRKDVFLRLAGLLTAAVATALLSLVSDQASAAAGVLLAIGAAGFALRRLQQMDALPGAAQFIRAVGQRLRRCR